MSKLDPPLKGTIHKTVIHKIREEFCKETMVLLQ